jgi:16S rRNA (cytidine1402-2'-O)-methyltransferase
VGTLYLVATPIGNLEDITLRALRVLAEVKLIAAEDTRQTRKILTRYKISTPLLSYHEHNKAMRLDPILTALQEGDVALVSDAGTPALSDPGSDLVRSVLERGHNVVPIPGAAAPVAALVASGLPSDSFVFLGYLPRRKADRDALLGSIVGERRTLLAFEVPHRLCDSLDDLVRILGSGRRAAICRELTKIHEEILRGDLGALRDHFKGVEPRGEFTLVIGGASGQTHWDEATVRNTMRDMRRQGVSRSEAASRVAALAGWPRRKVYSLGLEE